MKNILLGFACFVLLFTSRVVKAQQFSVASDTVYATVSGTATVYDNITNNTSTGLMVNWTVVATTFPPDWLTATAFGVCDNMLCRTNSGDTLLWRVAAGVPGTTQNSGDYTPGVAGPFDLSLNLTGASSGTHWVTIRIASLSDQKNVTFVINKFPTAVSNVNTTETGVALYPNPAKDELNIMYNANADIKTVAVYNVIGKVMNVYKVSGPSANLNISNIPSGIYFVRLTNSRGDVVVTRKFTKQ